MDATATRRTRAVLLATTALVALAAAPPLSAAGTTNPPRAIAQAYAHRTYVNDPSGAVRRFELAGHGAFALASDGSTIAAFAIVLGDGDGTGQAVLVFRNGKFLGWASAFDSGRLAVSSTGTAIHVRYAIFKSSDPLCCPSSSRTITYRWTNGRFTASGAPPASAQLSRLHLS